MEFINVQNGLVFHNSNLLSSYYSKTVFVRLSLSLTRKKTITGVFIIIVGIALSSLGFALASQTPETVNEETDDWWEGFALWSQNVGITFAKGFGTGLYYLGFIVIGGGAFALFYWQFKS